MRILAIESSSSRGSVALVEHPGGGLLIEREFEAAGRRSVDLPLAVAELLALAGAENRPERIVVGIGPGNYTGLRVAIATAQGLSLSLGIPAVGIPSWHGIRRGNGEQWLIGNAGRGRVFLLPLDAADATGIELIAATELGGWLDDRPQGEVIRLNAIPGAERIEERHPSAALLALRDPMKFAGSDGPIEPVYLQAACEPPKMKRDNS